MLRPGHVVLLVSPKGKRYFKVPVPGDILNTHDGALAIDDVLKAGIGGKVKTHLGREYSVLRPTLYDLIKNIRRQTQIIYPKDIGYIVVKLGIGPGSRVIESGSGSGSLTTALAWFVGDEGRVYTYERREEFSELCGKNLAWAGLEHRVERFCRDISEGFAQINVDALFLDVRTPWDYLEQAAHALVPGGPIGFLLPTANQVNELLQHMEDFDRYMEYNGHGFPKRFDPLSYLYIVKMMNIFDCTRHYDDLAHALLPICAKVMLVAFSISGDIVVAYSEGLGISIIPGNSSAKELIFFASIRPLPKHFGTATVFPISSAFKIICFVSTSLLTLT